MYGIFKNQVAINIPDAQRPGNFVPIRRAETDAQLSVEDQTWGWCVAAEYAYGGTLDVDKQSTAPVAAGGRGNLVGSFPDTGIFFLAANFTWKF